MLSRAARPALRAGAAVSSRYVTFPKLGLSRRAVALPVVVMVDFTGFDGMGVGKEVEGFRTRQRWGRARARAGHAET